MSRSIKKNTIYSAVKMCSTMLFPIITMPYVNRVLLPDNVGKVDFARSFINWFSLIASLGIFTYAVRECAAARDDRDRLSRIASQLYSINLIMTAVAYGLLAAVMAVTGRLEDYRLLIAICSSTLFFAALGADWLNSAMEDFRYIAVRTVLFHLLSLFLLFVFVRDRDDYVRYALIRVLPACGAGLLNARYRRRFCAVRFTLDIDWKRHLAPIVYLFVMSLSSVVFHNADMTMLGIMKGDYEVGIYSTAYKVTGMAATIVTSVGLVFMPRLSYHFSREEYDSANSLLRKLLGLNIGIGLPCVTGILMLADDIALLVGGSAFAASAPVMRILILGLLFSLVGGDFLGNAILIATKKEKYYMIVCCVTAVINVIINALLIPSLGARGAAIATALNGLLILLLLLCRVDRHVKISGIPGIVAGPAAGCGGIVLCCICCTLIRNIYIRAAASVAFSVIVYAGILVALRNEFILDYVRPLTGRMKVKKRK